MVLKKDKRQDVQIAFALLFKDKPTLRNIAKYLEFSENYIVQIFNGRHVSKKLAKRISEEIDKPINDVFDE